jgi:osmotically inducible lipoprotein OsmB
MPLGEHQGWTEESFMVRNFMKYAGVAALVLGVTTVSAQASCEGRATTGTAVGAVAGGLIGNQASGGDTGATIGGAVLGGIAGNVINSSGCNDRDRAANYDRRGNKIYHDRRGRAYYLDRQQRRHYYR